MPVTDVATFVGGYPFRHVDGRPDRLLRQMDRLRIERAWVGHLPSFLYKDPGPGNAALGRLVAPHRDRMFPVPTIHPELPHWEDDLQRARDARSPAIRLYPQHAGGGGAAAPVAQRASELKLPVVLTVRLEDVRQRHPLDVAPDLTAADVRVLARGAPGAKLLLTHADRGFVEEVQFGLTPAEASRLLWDISCIWGPPEDHLALLLETVGAEQFCLGTGMPLRIADAAIAKLDLLEGDGEVARAILSENLERWWRR